VRALVALPVRRTIGPQAVEAGSVLAPAQWQKRSERLRFGWTRCFLDIARDCMIYGMNYNFKAGGHQGPVRMRTWHCLV
jgi:hypothetical protein